MFGLFATVAIAQPKPGGTKPGAPQPKGDPKKAKALFELDRNYKDALTEYLRLLNDDPKNVEIKYRIGLCYLSTNIDKKKAIPYLEAMARESKAPKDVYLELGRAYHLANRYDDAIKKYTEYIELAKLRPEDARRVNKAIDQCRVGKYLVENPVEVEFECLSKDINTPFPEMYPFITADESFMIFTSRSNKVTGGFKEMDGNYSSDIFSSTQVAGKWSKPKNLSSIVNTQFYEVGTSMTPDGKNVVVYFSNEIAQSDLYLLGKKEKAKTFSKAVSLGDGVNTAKFLEVSGAVSPDGKFLIFSSDRPGGKGGLDLYVSYFENGAWGPAENLGSEINTEWDEDYPSFSPDGSKMYFASNSEKSMGGFDIFSAKYNKATKTFVAPTNMGYPINTADDNQTISFNNQGNVAYVSQQREGGIGELDIWRLTFKNAENDIAKTRVKGFVKPDTALATITIKDNVTGKQIQTVKPDNSGAYYVDLIPGRYKFVITANGYADYAVDLPIGSGAGFVEKLEKDFDLLNPPAPPATKPGTTPPAGTKPSTPTKPTTPNTKPTGTMKPKTP